ncbi:transposase [Iamia sp.]|uniref:transposase n=1 Tax=Iamia sp. TaxID=2722710 RepID=UPI002C1C9944|nr:transposase [Iamia sp.]HXH56125.1 transposase [Iamia sp.]
MRIELDGIVGLGELEDAALAFGRSAPAQLVADAIESMVADLLDVVVGPFGLPLATEDQSEALFACTRCASRRGFRRRGFRPKLRKVTTVCGQVAFRSQQLECLTCGRRFAPAAELLGLTPHQRRTDQLSEMAASLAVEVAYAKASRLLAELAGPQVSARSIRRDVIAMAPDRVGPEVCEVPVLLLDGTGERAGQTKGGVALNLAIGLVARTRQGQRVKVEARLLGATLGEGWSVMGDLLAEVRPGLILVDGEEELSALAAERFPDVPVQRCLWHLSRGVYRAARYTDKSSHDLATDFGAQLETLLTNAYRSHDLNAARTAYDDLIDDAEACGARAAAAHLRGATDEVFTFLTHPAAGRLLFGDKGRPEVGTGVLERVMREMNRRTDVGVRWSIPGVRAILMVKLQRKYHHGPWAPTPAPHHPPTARFSLAP